MKSESDNYPRFKSESGALTFVETTAEVHEEDSDAKTIGIRQFYVAVGRYGGVINIAPSGYLFARFGIPDVEEASMKIRLTKTLDDHVVLESTPTDDGRDVFALIGDSVFGDVFALACDVIRTATTHPGRDCPDS